MMDFYRRFKFFLLCILLVTAVQSQTRQRTDHWKLRNDQFNQELDSIAPHGVVFLGNSIIEGFDLNHYFPGAHLINRGIVGDHMDGLIERLNNSAVALNPQRLFLMIGINDIGDRRDDAYLKSMFVILLDTLQKELPETEIFVHSILPTTSRWKNCPPAQIKRINGFLAALALEREVQFINLYPDYLSGLEYLNPELTQDGLHLNVAGYDHWVERIKPFLEH
ncbi:MAG: hypothetical protein K9M55_03765 [Candidatus Marinimicrobia bacterium]|nr:hypothetical protein [Candidatus Neomarinimicrobiota bacterium]MCF7921797.1 hypothetical protein [Candidatus Neomarinimicrobiota bacterium]